MMVADAHNIRLTVLVELMNVDFLIRYIIETDQLLKDGCSLQTLLHYDLRLQCIGNS